MAEPLLRVWDKGRPIYRIHDRRFGPAEFNASGRGDARVSPLFDERHHDARVDRGNAGHGTSGTADDDADIDAPGKDKAGNRHGNQTQDTGAQDAHAAGVIATLYGGSSFDCAVMETIFHDLPVDPSSFILDFEDFADARFSTVAPARDLRLLDLTSIGLKALKLTKTGVIETGVDAYPETRRLALRWYRRWPTIDGLLWTSRQDDTAQACMLFGERVGAGTLQRLSSPIPVAQPVLTQALITLAKKLGISSARAFPSGLVGF
jgi:hypothetical protein